MQLHPAVIPIPAALMMLGPRFWVARVLKQYDQEQVDLAGSAAELARSWLDAHQLQLVKVEITDLGDHYDPQAKAVRLSRDRFDRQSLTALTTAAHEVSHALQHATGYSPFVWRTRLAGLARASGHTGAVILLSVSAAALFSRRPPPPLLIGATLLVMLGTGLALQVATLQSELDASFKRAMPILANGAIDASQLEDARKILIACSLTYVVSPVLSVLNIWPWLGRGLRNRMSDPRQAAVTTCQQQHQDRPELNLEQRESRRARQLRYEKSSPGPADRLVRRFGKPLIRSWLRFKAQLD